MNTKKEFWRAENYLYNQGAILLPQLKKRCKKCKTKRLTLIAGLCPDCYSEVYGDF